MKNVSKGFHEYMKIVSPLKDFQFKDLRKTKMTLEAKAVGKDRTGNHSTRKTTDTHYYNHRVLLPFADENPTIFPGVRLLELVN